MRLFRRAPAPRRPLVERLADWANPVVVKELRQAVNGRFVGGVLVSLLAVQLTVIALMLLGEDLTAVDRARGFGRQLFTALLGVLTFTSMLAMPLYAGGRTVAERAGTQLDLLYATTLPRRQIVGGKLQAVAVLTALLYVAQLPLLSLCYLLRGIDLPSMAALIAGSYLLVLNAAAVSLAAACLPVGRVMRVVTAFAFLGSLLFTATLGTAFAGFALEMGVGARLATTDVWSGLLVVLVVDALALRLLFLLTVAMISPPVANRARPVRRFLVVVWVTTLGAAVATALLLTEAWPLRGWLLLATWSLVPLLLTAASGRDELSRPQRREVPVGGLRRALAFPLFSGAPAGFAFAALWLLATVAVAVARPRVIPGWAVDDERLPALLATLGGYLFAYAGTATLLVRGPLRRRFAPHQTWVIALLIAAFASVAPPLVGFLLDPTALQQAASFGAWLVLSPAAAFRPELAELAGRIAIMWCGVVAAGLASWWMRGVRGFRPAVLPAAKLTAPPALEPGTLP